MSPERVEQLFEPFSRSTSGGTGLGLSIVYQIIRDHNGTINVSSIEGEGTTIMVELPQENRPRLAESAYIEDRLTPNPIRQHLNVKNPGDKVSA
jgi:nitrogen-specific signal transduction histidine kinase